MSFFLLDEICGSFLEHVTSLEKVCSVPVVNMFPQVKASADEVIKKQSKTTQPTLWCSLDEEGLLNQAFVVVDKAIFIEVSNVTYLNALLALMAVYFTFNLSYDKRQELVFQFIEEFILGLRPAKKSVRYRTMCMLVLPDN